MPGSISCARATAKQAIAKQIIAKQIIAKQIIAALGTRHTVPWVRAARRQAAMLDGISHVRL